MSISFDWVLETSLSFTSFAADDRLAPEPTPAALDARRYRRRVTLVP